MSKNIPFVNSSQNSKENSSFQNANMCLMHVGHFFFKFSTNVFAAYIGCVCSNTYLQYNSNKPKLEVLDLVISILKGHTHIMEAITVSGHK